jgi:hypothetical protein
MVQHQFQEAPEGWPASMTDEPDLYELADFFVRRKIWLLWLLLLGSILLAGQGGLWLIIGSILLVLLCLFLGVWIYQTKCLRQAQEAEARASNDSPIDGPA